MVPSSASKSRTSATWLVTRAASASSAASDLLAREGIAEMSGGGLQPGEMPLEQMEARAPLIADGLDQLEGRVGLGSETAP